MKPARICPQCKGVAPREHSFYGAGMVLFQWGCPGDGVTTIPCRNGILVVFLMNPQGLSALNGEAFLWGLAIAVLIGGAS